MSLFEYSIESRRNTTVRLEPLNDVFIDVCVNLCLYWCMCQPVYLLMYVSTCVFKATRQPFISQDRPNVVPHTLHLVHITIFKTSGFKFVLNLYFNRFRKDPYVWRNEQNNTEIRQHHGYHVRRFIRYFQLNKS